MYMYMYMYIAYTNNAHHSCPTISLFQYDQLVLLEQQINTKINSNDPGTDVGYWESLLQQLKAHMARVSNGHTVCGHVHVCYPDKLHVGQYVAESERSCAIAYITCTCVYIYMY